MCYSYVIITIIEKLLQIILYITNIIIYLPIQLSYISNQNIFIMSNENNVGTKLPIIVKFKRLNVNAVVPKYAKPGDACVDLVATSLLYDEVKGFVYGTGLAVEIPQGYVGRIYPRSSNCKTKAYLTNSVGNVDSGYRGEVMVVYKNTDQSLLNPPYKVGDRIAQFCIEEVIPIEFMEVEELSKTERGEGGYGHTGR